MKTLHLMVVFCGLLVTLLACHPAWADVFNMGGTRNPTTGVWTGSASLEFVTVGDPGNAANVTAPGISHGAVSYSYQIGKYDVTMGQYCQFLNAIAKLNDPYGLYSASMAPGSNLANTLGITRSGSLGNYTYTVTGNANYPVNCIGWGDAARFCNWLGNGQPTGSQGPGSTETGSYMLNGATDNATLSAVSRSPGASYVLPTLNEWYKAAFYRGGSSNAGYWLYATQSGSVPSNVLSSTGTNNMNYRRGSVYTDPVNYLTTVGAFAGSPGAYGTFDQLGDVWQWNEDAFPDDTKLRSGGSYREGAYPSAYGNNLWVQLPTDEFREHGFRVALVPEPATLSLLTLGGLLIARRRRA